MIRHVLEVDSLTKRFGAVEALRGVSLDVAAGEVVALMGANGAGKSTLLRILGGTILPDTGRALIAGHDVVRSEREARRSAGFFLGEERAWYWPLSGRANLQFFGALNQLPQEGINRRIEALAIEFGFSEYLDRPLGTYSSGMKLKLSLARAVMSSPRLLLLDEPSRSLDPIASMEFREMVTDRSTRDQSGVLFATHDVHEAAEVAARVLILDHGEIVDECVPASASDLEERLGAVIAR